MKFEGLSLKNIKGIPISTVQTRMLSEMGFPVDVSRKQDMSSNSTFNDFISKIFDIPNIMAFDIERFYVDNLIRSKNKDEAFALTISKLKPFSITAEELTVGLKSNCVYDLTAEEAETLIAEFIFIINELLPRQLSDIYYSFDIEPNPAYSLFFQIAADKLNLKRYNDIHAPWHGQFIGHVEEGIKKRIENGESLISIYKNTCATKTLIKDTFYTIPRTTLNSIEIVLFSLSKNYNYEKNDRFTKDACDFYVYENGKKILNIIFLSEKELAEIEDYDAYISELYTDGIPLLVLDEYEKSIDYLSNPIRKAIKDPEYIIEHASQRSKCFKFEKAFREAYHNHKFAKSAKLCGCFSCGAVFAPNAIEEWRFDNQEECDGYAICPKCGESTIIMDSQGYEISNSYIDEMIAYVDEIESFDYY